VKEYTTKKILNGISENNNIIVQYIYDRYTHTINYTGNVWSKQLFITIPLYMSAYEKTYFKNLNKH
jgi:hypothetical protein